MSKELYYDNIFRLLVYCISLYLILIRNSILINICGWTILISHIYKDITNLNKWPQWCEYCGIIIGILLIYSGFKINNLFILFIGFSKFLAHIRQLIFKDNRYYY